MINYLIKKILNKDIVLITYHRNSSALINNRENRNKYIFINTKFIWRIFPLPGKYKIKYVVVSWILNIIKPKFIIDINWTTKWQSLYKAWTKNNMNCKFVVIQHGIYCGGIISKQSISHKYTKCDIFLCWGDYFKNYFENINDGKRVCILSFGNPLYNKYNRDSYQYCKKAIKNILIAPSGLEKVRLAEYKNLVTYLKSINYNISISKHNMQDSYYEVWEDINIVKINIEESLENKIYDLIISDHSTLLLDAIYFKNKVLYYAPPCSVSEYLNNIYSEYLVNIYYIFQKLKANIIIDEYINEQAQEMLFKRLITLGNNDLSILEKCY